MAESLPPTALIDLGRVEREAADWVARRDRSPLTDDESQALAEWCQASVHHQAALDRLQGLWAGMDGLHQLALVPAPSHNRFLGMSWTGRAVLGGAIAASVALVIVVAAGRGYIASAPDVQVFGTGLGEQKSLRLGDGSTIQLNTNSRVEVEYARTWRKVRLLKGEAYFDVAHNPDRPFTVYAGDSLLRDIGTRFNVRLRNERMELTVTHGAVEVLTLSDQRGGGREVRDGTGGDRSFVFKPIGIVTAPPTGAEVAILSGRDLSMAERPENTINRQLAWREGMMAFSDEPLVSVIAEVSRYTDINIEIADPKLKDVRVGAYLKVGEVDPLLDALHASFGVRVHRIDAHHIRLTAS